MLIMPAELVKKIDDNRGDVSQAEFVELLISGQLKQNAREPQCAAYATKEEIYSFEQDMRKTLRSFLDFFITYGLELGKQSSENGSEELTSKLQGLQKDLDSDSDRAKATIKWK